MRPGKPLMVGRYRDTPMIGLPGNPVSTLVCGLLFVKPAIERLLGLAAAAEPPLRARLAVAARAPTTGARITSAPALRAPPTARSRPSRSSAGQLDDVAAGGSRLPRHPPAARAGGGSRATGSRSSRSAGAALVQHSTATQALTPRWN